MNLLQGKSNQYLREAILEGSVEKARRYLTLKIGKADVAALTESGGFSMLHCACLVGNTQIAMMLLQYGADVLALTDVRLLLLLLHAIIIMSDYTIRAF